MTKFKPGIAIPPGETLLEVLVDRRWSSGILSYKSCIPEDIIIGILEGTRPIDQLTASRLEMALEIPASFWRNLDSNYWITKVRLEGDLKA